MSTRSINRGEFWTVGWAKSRNVTTGIPGKKKNRNTEVYSQHFIILLLFYLGLGTSCRLWLSMRNCSWFIFGCCCPYIPICFFSPYNFINFSSGTWNICLWKITFMQTFGLPFISATNCSEKSHQHFQNLSYREVFLSNKKTRRPLLKSTLQIWSIIFKA